MSSRQPSTLLECRCQGIVPICIVPSLPACCPNKLRDSALSQHQTCCATVNGSSKIVCTQCSKWCDIIRVRSTDERLLIAPSSHLKICDVQFASCLCLGVTKLSP